MTFTLLARDLPAVLNESKHEAWESITQVLRTLLAPKCEHLRRARYRNITLDEVISYALYIEAMREHFDPWHTPRGAPAILDRDNHNCFPGLIRYARGRALRYIRKLCSAQLRRSRSRATSSLEVHADQATSSIDPTDLGVTIDGLSTTVESYLKKLKRLLKNDELAKTLSLAYAQFAGCYTPAGANAAAGADQHVPHAVAIDVFFTELARCAEGEFLHGLPAAAGRARSCHAVLPVIIMLRPRAAVARSLGLTANAVHSAVVRHRHRLPQLGWQAIVAATLTALRKRRASDSPGDEKSSTRGDHAS